MSGGKIRFGPKIHLGCGKDHKSGFVNVDPYMPHGKDIWDVKEDALRYMKLVPSCSVTHILSRHMIEHLHKQRARNLVMHCFRALKSGGTATFECPDLLFSCRAFVESEGKAQPGGIYGKHRHAGDTHLWGYSEHTLREMFEAAGFRVTYLSSGSDRHSRETNPGLRIDVVKP